MPATLLLSTGLLLQLSHHILGIDPRQQCPAPVKNQVCNENILCRLLEKLLQNLLGHVFDPIEIQ